MSEMHYPWYHFICRWRVFKIKHQIGDWWVDSALLYQRGHGRMPK